MIRVDITIGPINMKLIPKDFGPRDRK